MPATSGVAPWAGERPRVRGPCDPGARLPRPADAWPFARPPETGLREQTFIALVGMGLGRLVNWLDPRPVLPYPWLRLTNLVFGPVFAGGLSAAIARWRSREPRFHFGMAFCFVLGCNLVRFAYAHV